ATTAAKVTLSGVGLGFSPVEIELNPGELREIPDVVASALGAERDAAGAIQVQSDAAVVVRARTSSAGVGAFNAMSPPPVLAGEGSTATLIGLRGAASTIGFVTTTGAVAGLTLNDGNGNLVAAQDAGVALEPGSVRETLLAELFPGTDIPESAVLVIAVHSGSLAAYAQTTDAITGDWWIQTAN
ncbi:MAG: hypothetical protein ABIZ80_01485, partial [Bryobacteraceae bacterium]